MKAEKASAKAPTPRELEPLVIPSSSTTVSTFALDLDRACNSLLDDSKDRVTATRGRAAANAPSLRAALTGKKRTDLPFQNLKQTCVALAAGTPSPDDWQNLEDFRNDPNTTALASMIERGATPQSTPAAAPLTSIGSIAENVIGGLEKFLYDRAKAEAALYLSARLKEQLCSAENKPFFPNLCIAFEELDFRLPLGALGTYLIAAARKDLEQFPDTTLVYALHELVDDPASGAEPTCKADRQDACNALFGARLALTAYRAVASRRTALDVARGLYLMKPSFNPAPSVLDVARNGSALIDAVYTQDGWQSVTSPNEKQKVGCYTAAVYLSLKQTIHPNEPLPSDITAAMNALPPLMVTLNQLLQRAEGALAAVAAREAKAAQAVTENDSNEGGFPASADASARPSSPSSQLSMRDYVLTATQMLQAAVDVRLHAAFGFPTAHNDDYLQTLRSAATLGEAITARDDAVQTTLLALDFLRQLISVEMERKQLTQDQVDRLRKVQAIVPLITQLASAKSADEAANVFQTAAVSVDTYAVKYEKSMIALNALVGVAGGSEFVSIGDKTRGSGIMAGFAPVGFQASWPFGSGHWHVGAMLSVLDLGSLITARFQADTETKSEMVSSGGMTSEGTTSTTVSKEPQIDLVNLVSPGFFVTLGIYNSPFVIGAGARVLPARKTESTAVDGTTSSSSTPAVQILGTVSVDVPIFQF